MQGTQTARTGLKIRLIVTRVQTSLGHVEAALSCLAFAALDIKGAMTRIAMVEAYCILSRVSRARAETKSGLEGI
jgi:hypothetical protein